MRGRDDINLVRLLEIYAVANTPNYLYRHFKNEISVTHLSKIYSPEQLASYVRTHAPASNSIEEAVCIYAAIVALGRCPSGKAIEAMEGVNLGTLRWASSLWNICRKNFISSVLTNIEIPLPSWKAVNIAASNVDTSISDARSAMPRPVVITPTSGHISSKITTLGDRDA